MTNTLTTLKNAIADTLGLHAHGIADDQTLTDLGADSLDMVEIAMAVEDALNLQDHIADEAMENRTIAQISAAIDAMQRAA